MIFYRLRYFLAILLTMTFGKLESQVIADALPGCLEIETIVGVACNLGNITNPNAIQVIGNQVVATGVDGANCCLPNGGDWNSYFEFEEITIDCFEDIMISMDYSASGDFEDDFPSAPAFGCTGTPADNGHDQIVFTYSLDGGTEIQSLYVHGEDAIDFTGTWIEGPLNGNTLRIKVYASNKSNSETFFFENLIIEAGSTSASAGDDFTYCGDGPIDLDGSGDGTWSGGLGTFSDTTDPNSTYTPDATEFGTTVILTYGGCAATAGCATADVSDEVEITIFQGATASIDQSTNGELCFGECTTIKFDFIGGAEPYDLDLTFNISGVGFPINFNAPGFAASDVITICYDITGIFPQYDAGSQTISVPEIAAGLSGNFTLNSFTDDNGCEGTVTGSGFAIAFLDTPEANFASLEECDEGGGMATFDLTEMDNDVNGGSGETVRYYDDPALTNEVFSPYISPSSVLYATVSNADCTSEPEEVEVIVLSNGDAGIVELYCTDLGTTDCIICDDDGVPGQAIQVLFVFNDPSLPHEIILELIDDDGSVQTTYNLAANQTNLTITISSNTTIELLAVTEGNGCADTSDLGGIVTITYLVAPELDPIGPLSECGSITLPAITGTDLSGSELYYTETNQGGDSYAEGAIITSSVDLFVYSGVPECFDEIMVEIEILPGTTFDEPNDTTSCGPYTLPDITGTGINSTAAYYTLSGGNGNIYIPGNIVLSNTTLYIFDPASSCSSNEPSFMITIFETPTIEVMNIDTCGVYELPIITGVLLTSNEGYYTEPNGMGVELMVGDTIFATDTIYAFDNNNGCIAEEEIIIKIGEGPTAGVGDTISICSDMNPLIVNLPMLLSEPADTLGMWSDDMGIIMDDTDSTLVNIAGITGVINFMYVIENMECGNDTSHLQINVQEQLDAGGQDLLTGCEDEFSTIDLNSFWNIVGTNDTIIVIGGAVIDVTDPSVVDISILDPGMYNLQYIVGMMDTVCMPDTANLTIEIDEAPDAGEDVNTTTCAGNIVQLENVLQGNNTVGVFGDPGATGALTGSNVNSGILGVGIFTFTHTVAGNGACDGETIEIEIEVTTDVTAGNSVIDTICYTDEINLFDYLDGASQGGTFFDVDNGNLVIPDGILIANTAPGVPRVINILYEVGDDIDCPKSTATLELTILPEPAFNLLVLESFICDSILNVRMDYTYLTDFDFTLEIDGSLPELPISIPFIDVSPTLLAADMVDLQLNLAQYNLPAGMVYSIRIATVTRGDCISEIVSVPGTFNIGTQDTLMVNDILCGDDMVEYGGQFFNATNPSDEITIQRPGQCDSIIIVDLIFEDPATSLINNTLCTGQSITLGGTVYDESFPSGEFILFGGSANGCDSTVMIDLMFADASVNNVVENICQGETLTFNSIVYDQNNLMGSDTLIGGSNGGCDSIINVNLTLVTTDIGTEMTTTCDLLYSTTVNGVLFDLNNPIGSQTILGGSVNGCDSTVMINITFLDPATGLEDGSICPGESIMVNGNTYDQDLLIGTEMFFGQASNGCDSIVNINLTLLEVPEGNFINSSCDENYELSLNGNTYNVANPMGTEMISGGASNGCDSIVNIQLSFDGITAMSTIAQANCADNTGSVTITSINGTGPFFWAQSGDTVVEITGLPYTIEDLTGAGDINLADSDGCETMVSYSISDFITPTLTSEVIDNQIFVSGIPLDEINSIAWTPTDGLSCTDCLDPTFLVTEDTEYLITINYSDGCDISLTIPVMAEEIPIIPTYNIPNVFSPNGDGNNDVFYIIPSATASNQIASMTIYDRWGNQVYRKENYINEIGVGWDGTYNGKELNPGVYVYLIEVLENDVIIPFYGDVTIVK